MVTKPSDLFPRLPSVNELLEKPPVRALVDRWNRSTVAAGVRSFLEELRSDVERRAADFQMPSLRDIAERAARHVAAQQQSAVRPAVNATGRFFGAAWNSAPLADVALERMICVARGYVLDASPLGAAAATKLCQLTGAEAAIVVSSYSGAVSLALSALAADREVLVARGELGGLADGGSLSAIAQASGVLLREIGAVNRSTACEYEASVTDRTAAILRHTPEAFRIEGDAEFADDDAMVGLARDRELPLVELLGSAPLVGGLPALAHAPCSVADRIAAGAQLVVFRGDGLLGGPTCGVVLGNRRLIDRLESHPLFAAWRADSISLAALEATLALYDDPERLALTLPVFQLLSTSLENLRQRAERMAPQLAQAADVECANACESESSLGFASLPNDKLPSCAVSLVPNGGNVALLEKRLRQSPVPIVARRYEDRLLVDLRTVLPRQDQTIVDMVVGPSTTAQNTSAETAVPATV